MSGILAAFRTDGAPIDPALIVRLTQSMARRGPDRQETWSGGRVALGHALLRTASGPDADRQPFTIDGDVRIVADARIDARDDLTRELGAADAGDAELILRAYLRWGDACVEHLLGDFAFAIWDGRARRLFCARDHMGVKPLYYAAAGRWLVLGSMLETLRLHPGVSSRLDDLAIADFLLFGCNQEPSTTSFADVRRLPAAHALVCDAAGLRITRYWTLPIEEPLYFRRQEEYVERFHALLRQSVSDRLQVDRVGVFMSGGLDSTALAATARDLLRASPATAPVRAFTGVYDSLIPDSEREFAGRAAEHLGIPIAFYPLDARLAWAPSAAAATPEPLALLSDRDADDRCHADMAAHSRVAFHGEGPDDALWYEWRPHVTTLWRRRQWGRLAADAVEHLASHRRVPILPTIPRMLRDRREAAGRAPVFPAWLAPDLVRRLGLEDRWRTLNAAPRSAHPFRPEGHAALMAPQWQHFFETLEPSYTGVAMEVRHPYLDIRVLGFLLRMPALPWCRSKYLMRRALRGVVPESVRRRPKTPLRRFPDYERVARLGLPPARPGAPAARYGDAGNLSYSPRASIESVLEALRLVALSHWIPDPGATHGLSTAAAASGAA